MRVFSIGTICVVSALALAGCEKPDESQVNRTIEGVNAIDGNNINDVMLTVADPNEAVAYFTNATAQQPDRMDLQRGLAQSLVRAGRATEAVIVWQKIVDSDDVTNDDHIALADAYIRTSDWVKAKEQLDAVPPTYETFKRYRLEAMVADSNRQWDRADAFYETAVGLTTQPATTLNNWGYSKLTRGDATGAERLFTEAITYDPGLFIAKNNLVLARAAQGNYHLPLVQMSQVERAQLLHTMALSAIKRGDVETGRGLLEEAIDTHPRHFAAAQRSLDALNSQTE